jgi:hypothetical protein
MRGDFWSIFQVHSPKHDASAWICRTQTHFDINSVKESVACNQSRTRESLLLRAVSLFKTHELASPKKFSMKPAVEIRKDSTAGDSL